MATIVASRYAVLSVDDDEDGRSKKKKIPNKKPDPPKQPNSNSVKTDNSKKKKKQDNSQSQNQSKKPNKSNNPGATKKKKEATTEQWEEWKQKDAQFVEGSFEEDLSKAILLSKLDYEQNKDLYEAIRKSEEEAKKSSGKKNKKGQKIMSLSEFNSLACERNSNGKTNKTEKVKEEPEFFNKLDEDIKNEILKEQFSDKRKVKDTGNHESLLLVMYKESIENKDREIQELREEIERLNIQLKNVKTRNLKLCQIIGNGEMKDKAEVLMEVERLQTIKDELSSEISSLHIQLEQERSKVRQLTAEQKNKDKGKKHHNLADVQ